MDDSIKIIESNSNNSSISVTPRDITMSKIVNEEEL